MKTMLVAVLLLIFALAGCGVNKDFVQQQIQESESRTDAKISQLSNKTNTNADEINKLQTLAAQLSEKTDLAINKAAGFENYQVIWSGTINFDFDSWEITPTAEQTLLDACEKMGQNPSSLVEIAGFTDKTGPASYNLMLGQKRAEAAKRYIADHCGIALYRLFVVSYGEEKPVASGEGNANAKNRRVEIKVWGTLQ